MSGPPRPAAVTLGSRASVLARAQAQWVEDALRAAWPEVRTTTEVIVTAGDRSQASGQPLPEIGGKGLFTAELERALLDGEIDLAVHSLKDLPTEWASGVVIGAVCARDDVRDCLVSRDGSTLAALAAGSVVGTSSLRRAAQLRALRPDLELRPIRGNVDTRVRKAREGEFDAVVLAAAGVRRLALEGAVTEWLPTETMLPAPGQGALGVQCRATDESVLSLVDAIDDPAARAETSTERAFLRALGGGCAAPVAAHARVVSRAHDDDVSPEEGTLSVRMDGLVSAVDGSEVVRVSGVGSPVELGERLAREALDRGADRILGAIRAR